MVELAEFIRKADVSGAAFYEAAIIMALVPMRHFCIMIAVEIQVETFL